MAKTKQAAKEMIELLDSELRKMDEEINYDTELLKNNPIHSPAVKKTLRLNDVTHDLIEYYRIFKISTLLKFAEYR